MLTLPHFELALPRSMDEAVAELSAPTARLLAGGTDLLVNMKHGIEAPEKLVSLQRLSGLRGIEETSSSVVMGAMCTLTEVAGSEAVRTWFPSLATAARSVASAQIRQRGTLGGNINLDLRCRYLNQSVFWREALGGCLKAQTCASSNVCHVVPKGRTCVAAMTSDTVPVLISLGATLKLRSETERELPIAEYFRSDGVRHTVREPREILTHIRLQKPTSARKSSYTKWAVRGSIDFPLVSVALSFGGDVVITDAIAVLGVLGAKPRTVGLRSFLGRKYDDPTLPAELADAVVARARTLPNVPYDPAHRRHLVGVLTRRALEKLF